MSKITRSENKAKSGGESASMSSESYVIMTIGGEGAKATVRVLDSTAPLALAGM